MSKEIVEQTIAGFKAEIDSLKPAYDRYLELSRQLYKLEKELKEKTKKERLRRLLFVTYYEDPTEPSMGVSGELGSANFKDMQIAMDLISALNENSGYYRIYDLKWTEPGAYEIEAIYKYDHDNELIWTYEFRKSKNEQT